ncbi:hypothetical protein SEA_VANLEE_39 [Gordonia phage VanLee]|uniref:Uncharacterized protein n=1 Tax=Gordonia phage VanLee TaxID=2845816 RepID=A0A8F2IFE6_9CAUD|nr:hypothetical protein QEH49_gp039 [Gordonia phage VanLee]QWS68156.1 hypothetical protein SEA_VANLEE_39 [Gordonia phage VanLee]
MTPKAAILRDGEVIELDLIHVGEDGEGDPIYEALGPSLLPGDVPVFPEVRGTVRLLGPVR